ncbi:glutamate 5-kinase [Candidatus Endobugula sertula]|uniref:Glutamate 5-kinase n=1 Tax=Candidatus Endobugula sertula TaxID=62101 RepID=A0A1D2QNM0_9GAMM|nr:glutamate 5-kinase [Candidatus Endobugula sertula]
MVRSRVSKAHRWVVKIGSSLLTNHGHGLDVLAIQGWVEQIYRLQQNDVEIVLVSSGAVAAGMGRLGWKRRPATVHELQAAAAVGQTSLVQAYEQVFQKFDVYTAQVLVDHDDLSNRERYLNTRSTLKTLLRLGVVPIVNENDTVVTEEIRFGDNDTLAALIANLIEADLLILMTDQEGMYDSDPRFNGQAQLIDNVSAFSSELDEMAGDGGALGRGGMITKVRAARLAARSGANTVIVGGHLDNILLQLQSGERVGSLLFSEQQPQAARKCWLAGQLQSRGELILDDGAVRVLSHSGCSLLPVGVISSRGNFTRGDMVVCKTTDGREIARGLINYNSQETHKMLGQSSDQIEELLGYKNEEELIHRDNLVLV